MFGIGLLAIFSVYGVTHVTSNLLAILSIWGYPLGMAQLINTENFRELGSTWNQDKSHRKDIMSTENQILQDASVETDNLNPTEDQVNHLALSAQQSAIEFNTLYGGQQEQHFNELFRICWNQFSTDEKTYEEWFKVFQANLLYPAVVNPLNSVKNIKAYRKGKNAIEELRNLPAIDIGSEDGKSTRHVDIASIMRDNDGEFTDRFITKNSGILSALLETVETDPVNVEEKIVEFVSQNGGTNKKQSLPQIAGKGKNPIKAKKSHNNGKKKRSPLDTAISNLKRIANADWEIIVYEFEEEIMAVLGGTSDEINNE